MKQIRLHLTPRSPDLIAQASLSQRAFARRAGISFSTIYSILSCIRATTKACNGVQPVARAYSEIVGIDVAAAFQLLIVESHIVDRDARK